MFPPLFLDPQLQQRLIANPMRRRTRPSSIVVVNPIPFGWSEIGETLFYRFEEAPPSLLAWAHTDEIAQKQCRNRNWPMYVVVLVPDLTDLFCYASEMEEFNGLNIGVGLAGSWGTQEAWSNAVLTSQSNLD